MCMRVDNVSWRSVDKRHNGCSEFSKQVDLDRSNNCTKIHTKFIRIHFYIYRSIITKKKVYGNSKMLQVSFVQNVP